MPFSRNTIAKRFHRKGPPHHHPHSHPDHHGTMGVEKAGTREIKVVRKVLDANDAMAARNRQIFAEKGLFVLNVMSSPGSGKNRAKKDISSVREVPQIPQAKGVASSRHTPTASMAYAARPMTAPVATVIARAARASKM